MRRIAILGLAAAFGLGLAAGCGGPQDSTPTNPVTPAKDFRPKSPRERGGGGVNDKAPAQRKNET